MAEFLNQNIRFLRNKNSLSQQTLADKIGVDRSTISRIENGEIETTIDNAIKIAEVLHVSLTALVGRDLTDGNSEDDELFLLLSKYKNKLTENDKFLIKTIIEQRTKEIDKNTEGIDK